MLVFSSHEIDVVGFVGFIDPIINIFIWVLFYQLLLAKKRVIKFTPMRIQFHPFHHKVLLKIAIVWHLWML